MEEKGIERILVLRGGAIGDFILTIPAVEAIRRRWPCAQIDLATRNEAGSLAVECGVADRVRRLESGVLSRLFAARTGRDPDLADNLRRFDLAVCFLHDPDGRVARNLAAAGIPKVIAGSPIVRAGHAVDHFLHILETGGIDVVYGAHPRLRLPAARVAMGRHWRETIGAPAVVLHPGSGSRRKNWALEHFIALARKIGGSTALQPVFSTGEADAELAERIARDAGDSRLLADMPLPILAGILSAAAAYVGNDSGITHLAAALGVPVVAIFGTTDPATWGPRGEKVTCVTAAEQTSEGMQRITVEQVWAALAAQLQEAHRSCVGAAGGSFDRTDRVRQE